MSPRPIGCRTEVSERLVGSPAFKAGGMGDPCPAGSIPVHLRHQASVSTNTLISRSVTRSRYFA